MGKVRDKALRMVSMMNKKRRKQTTRKRKIPNVSENVNGINLYFSPSPKKKQKVDIEKKSIEKKNIENKIIEKEQKNAFNQSSCSYIDAARNHPFIRKTLLQLKFDLEPNETYLVKGTPGSGKHFFCKRVLNIKEEIEEDDLLSDWIFTYAMNKKNCLYVRWFDQFVIHKDKASQGVLSIIADILKVDHSKSINFRF
jgi:hypothetical protein